MRELFAFYERQNVAAMRINEWARRTEARIRNTSLVNRTHRFHGETALASIGNFSSTRSAFAHAVFPRAVRRLPVLYPFSVLRPL